MPNHFKSSIILEFGSSRFTEKKMAKLVKESFLLFFILIATATIPLPFRGLSLTLPTLDKFEGFNDPERKREEER